MGSDREYKCSVFHWGFLTYSDIGMSQFTGWQFYWLRPLTWSPTIVSLLLLFLFFSFLWLATFLAPVSPFSPSYLSPRKKLCSQTGEHFGWGLIVYYDNHASGLIWWKMVLAVDQCTSVEPHSRCRAKKKKERKKIRKYLWGFFSLCMSTSWPWPVECFSSLSFFIYRTCFHPS